jgi:hypothetical protein
MKFNWGYKILFAYLAFAGGILYMVYLTTLQNRDLVSENYYEEELAYQKVIDQSAKTAQLSAAVEVKVDQLNGVLEIQLPHEFNKINVIGKWNLYYPADQKMDVEGTINTQNGNLAIQLPKGRSGTYTLKLEWESNGQSYYFETIIYL